MRYEPGTAALLREPKPAPRRLLLVRVTHWLMVLGVLVLLDSGIGILISHPRLYWGETGNVATASLIDLPVPFIIGPSVWNRPIHFFGAWLLLFAGLVYLVGSLVTRHLWNDIVPARKDLHWGRIRGVLADHLHWKRAHDTWTYNVVQRIAYLTVVFALFPGIIWTGLAMSFGVTSVFPLLATIVGGHQSARTLHFVFANLIVLYIVIHLIMLFLVGFRAHMRAMITGHIPQQESSR